MSVKKPDPLQRLRPGMRAVVRHAVPEGLTDSVGVIEGLDATGVTVRTKRGLEVIPVTQVTLAKEVPPRPTRRGAPHRAISIDDLERVMAAGWPAVERAQLGDWVLRASAGYTRRANSVLTVGDPGVPLDSAVDRAERWYADRDLPCRWVLHGPTGFATPEDPLGALLVARGYREEAPTVALTSATAAAPAAAAGAAAGPVAVVLSVDPAPTPAWWSLCDGRVGGSPQLRAAAVQVVTGAPEQLFLVAWEGDTAVAATRVAFAHVWAGLTGLTVHPDHRHHGLGTELVAEAKRQARDRGIRAIYLQVVPGNEAARGLYGRLGFDAHHEYRYLTAE